MISLEEAARQISNKDIEEQKLKTKIRRLYDIANVLQSIGLIQKTSYPQSKKPAFQWIGIEGVKNFVRDLKTLRKSGEDLNEIYDNDLAEALKKSVRLKKQESCPTKLVGEKRKGKRLEESDIKSEASSEVLA